MKIDATDGCTAMCEKTFCSRCGEMTGARHSCSDSGAFTGFSTSRPHKCPEMRKKPSERIREILFTGNQAMDFNALKHYAICAYLDELREQGKI